MERRPLMLLRLPLETDQQATRARGQQLRQMEGVALPGGRRQGDQRGAIIEGVQMIDMVDMEVEEVSAPQLDHALAEAFEVLQPIARDIPGAFGDELLTGLACKLDAQHRIALRRQPAHVETLATQRHQHLGARRDLKPRPPALQRRMRGGQMKADPPFLPSRQPGVTGRRRVHRRVLCRHELAHSLCYRLPGCLTGSRDASSCDAAGAARSGRPAGRHPPRHRRT